jgi:hypothetical protein
MDSRAHPGQHSMMILCTVRSPRSASSASGYSSSVNRCVMSPSVRARPDRSAAIAAGNESISAKEPLMVI